MNTTMISAREALIPGSAYDRSRSQLQSQQQLQQQQQLQHAGRNVLNFA